VTLRIEYPYFEGKLQHHGALWFAKDGRSLHPGPEEENTEVEKGVPNKKFSYFWESLGHPHRKPWRPHRGSRPTLWETLGYKIECSIEYGIASGGSIHAGTRNVMPPHATNGQLARPASKQNRIF